MIIIFTDFAVAQLKGIYDYYSLEVSESIALKVTDKILDRIETLMVFPGLGPGENYLSKLNLGHKYLVCGNYKVLYRKTKDAIYH